MTCSRDRGAFQIPNRDPGTEVFPDQTWARQNLIDGAFKSSTDPVTGTVTRSTDLSSGTFFRHAGRDDGRSCGKFCCGGWAGFCGCGARGGAFLRAVKSGVTTRNMWSEVALTEGLIDP